MTSNWAIEKFFFMRLKRKTHVRKGIFNTAWDKKEHLKGKTTNVIFWLKYKKNFHDRQCIDVSDTPRIATDNILSKLKIFEIKIKYLLKIIITFYEKSKKQHLFQVEKNVQKLYR